MKIALGSDHAGFCLKETIKKHLTEKGYEVYDVGTCSEESVHYPIYGEKAARLVASGEYTYGIVCCGTGLGISLAANRVKGIRCCVCSESYTAKMSREHNNCNMLALGGRVVGADLALHIVDTFLSAEFMGGKHQTRVDLLESIE